MMRHSDLTQELTELGRRITSLISMTSRGVSAEGGVVSNGESPAPKPAPPPLGMVTNPSGFVFGNASRGAMKDVHAVLIQVAELALKLSTQDFRFYEGARSPAQQRINVQKGVSKTMDSKHMIQADGKAHAMDLVPIIGGVPKWDWEGCYKIAQAVDKAATQLGVAKNIRWGGVWDRTMDKFGDETTPAAYMRAVQDYAARHPGKDFLDGPHFEWVS